MERDSRAPRRVLAGPPQLVAPLGSAHREVGAGSRPQQLRTTHRADSRTRPSPCLSFPSRERGLLMGPVALRRWGAGMWALRRGLGATSMSPGLCPQGGRFPSLAQGSWLWGPRDTGGDIGSPQQERNGSDGGARDPGVSPEMVTADPARPPRQLPLAPWPTVTVPWHPWARWGTAGLGRAGRRPWLEPGHCPRPVTWPRGPTPRPGHGASVHPAGMDTSSKSPPASALTAQTPAPC